jgi:chromosome segregation ATPase
MFEWDSELIIILFGTIQGATYGPRHRPGDLDSAAKAFADLKAELEKEKSVREIAQAEVDTLTRAVKDLKISADKFAAQVPILEEKVKHLENKVVDGLNEVRAMELCLEHMTKENDDYKKQNAQLTRKLESKFPLSFKALLCS